jgi:hypothetical protein
MSRVPHVLDEGIDFEQASEVTMSSSARDFAAGVRVLIIVSLGLLLEMAPAQVLETERAKRTETQSTGAVARGMRIHTPSYEDELRAEGYEPNSEGYRKALLSDSFWTRVIAIRIIRQRKANEFTEDLRQQLGHPMTVVRVEAGMALASFGDSEGIATLKQELEKARQAQQRVLSGEEALRGKNSSDLSYWVQGAGTLAECGDTSGYEVVKTTLLRFNSDACASSAAWQMPKFARFKDQHTDVLAALTQAMDVALTRIDERASSEPEAEQSPDTYFNSVAQALGQVGGEQAVAKLKVAAHHRNKHVRLTVKGILDEMERNGQIRQEKEHTDTSPVK